MKYVSLKNGNYKLSRIGLGTVQFGMDYGFTKAKSQAEVDQILQCCVENGVNFIDTAREYGDSEKKIGNFNKKNKADFIIGTKLSKLSAAEVKHRATMKSRIKESIEGSLKDLGIAKIPLLALHQTDQFLTLDETFWESVEQLREEGLFDLFGISVYEIEDTKKVLTQFGRSIDFIQLPFNVFDRRFQELFNLFKENDIDVISRSVFLKGVISAADEHVPSELKSLQSHKEQLKSLAQKLGLSESALALSYVLRESRIASSVLGINTVEELRQNIEALKQADGLHQLEEKIRGLAVADEFLIDPRKWAQL